MPLSESAQALKQCQYCYNSDSKEAPLLSCSQCKRAHYCSKECQTAHWKDHKTFCKMNRDTRDLMKEDSDPSTTSLLGLSAANLEVKIKNWVQIFRPILGLSAMHALDLQTTPQNCLTHLLHLVLSPNFTAENAPRKDNQLPRAFKLDDARVVLIQDFREAKPDFEVAIDALLVKSKAVQEQDADNIGLAIVAVVIPPIRVIRLVPLGIQGPAAELPPTNPEWKTDLEECIRRGILV